MIKISPIGGVLFLLLAGCSQMITPNASGETTLSPSETAQGTEIQGIPISPAEGDATQMIQPLPTSSNSGLQSLIEKAKLDLTRRLSISVTQISLVEVTEVEWSDSSLDCPQADMAYLQVITPGYRILLDANTQVYEYHSNKDAYVIYCENSVSPILPKP
jgi:hypothetical protein